MARFLQYYKQTSMSGDIVRALSFNHEARNWQYSNGHKSYIYIYMQLEITNFVVSIHPLEKERKNYPIRSQNFNILANWY